MKVKNKVIVVTGGGSGLGRALVLHLLDKGAAVAMADINEQGMEETMKLAGDVGPRLSKHVLDITNRDAVEQFPEEVIKAHGTVDGIINNAGIIQPFVDVKDLGYDRIEKIMNINFYGALYMIKAFLPNLLGRPEAHIVNVSSLGGFIPFPGQTIYGASKAALKLLTEGLYAELEGTSVHVTVIHPGAMDTNITVNSGVTGMPEAADADQSIKPLSPDVAAGKVVDAMERDKFRAMVGKDAAMLDILYRLNPRRAVGFIVKKMGALIKK